MGNYRDIAREQLKFDEGVKTQAYKDSEGLLTIGVGRLIDPSIKGSGLSPYEINVLLENDLVKAENDAKILFPSFDKLSDVRKSVLINMAFNLGRSRLEGFKNFKAAVEAGKFHIAAEEMLSSRWAQQVGKRAERLAHQMLTDKA